MFCWPACPEYIKCDYGVLSKNWIETDGSNSVSEFPTKRLDSLRNMDQDQHYYISQVCGMVQPLADAILAMRMIPLLPSVDHICQGIDIAVSDFRRANMLGDSSLSILRSPRTHNGYKVLDRTLVDPPMMDRILHSIISDAEGTGPLTHSWPAALHPSLIIPPPQPTRFCSSQHSSIPEVHLLPILFSRKWTLFLVDPQRGVIELLDFLYTSIGCDMRTFQVRRDSFCVE